jgi:deazaflavin-dependent oxidoreductase (nitroreductase family)
MSDSVFLYLTTHGRKSGQPRTIEIWFVERAGRYYLVAENRERAQWVQNLLAQPAVELSVGARGDEGRVLARTPGTARVLDVGADAELVAAVRALMDAKYDWSEGVIVELAPRP